MKLIPLTQGQFAFVDDADFEELSRFKWCAAWSPYTRTYYAIRSSLMVGGKRTTIQMSRWILGLTDPKVRADHKDHNTLDNQRANLRPATHAQNSRNLSGANRNSKTGVRGVCPDGSGYRAHILVGGKKLNLGQFKTIPEASAAYAVANRHHFGEFGGGL